MKLTAIFESLVEALKPSQYRPYVKNWDKSKYEELFRQYTKDRKAYRIYIPLDGEVKKVEPLPEVVAAVKDAGYEIEDYVLGIASKDDGKRKIKIGKLIKDPAILQKFANDPKRAAGKKADWYVVISRHPYDIAGMSTDRGWRSCMNLKDGINKHYVPLDIKEGTVVAYLVKADDLNINNPTARILIKPFVNIENKDQVAFGIEDRVYGTDRPGFTKTVQDWVDEVNKKRDLNGIFDLHSKLYPDGYGTKRKYIGKLGGIADMLKMVSEDPMSIRKIENPPEAVQKEAVTKRGEAIQYIKDPSEAIQLLAIKYKGSDVIKYIENPTETVALQAAFYPRYFDLLPEKYKTKEFILKLFNQNPEYIVKLDNVSEDQWKRALRARPHLLRDMKDPELIKRLVMDNPSLFEYLGEHTYNLDRAVHRVIHRMDKAFIDKLIDKHFTANVNWGESRWITYIIDHVSGKEKTYLTNKLFSINPDMTSAHLPKSVKYPADQVEAFLSAHPEKMHNFGAKNLTPEIMKAAVKKNPSTIMHCTEEVRLELLKETPSLIKYVNTDRDKMTNKVPKYGVSAMEVAVKTDPHVIKFTKAPSEALQAWALENGATADELWHLQTKYYGVKAMALMLHKKPSLRDDLVARLKKSRMSKKMEEVDRILHSLGPTKGAAEFKIGDVVRSVGSGGVVNNKGPISDISENYVTVGWKNGKHTYDMVEFKRYVKSGLFDVRNS